MRIEMTAHALTSVHAGRSAKRVLLDTLRQDVRIIRTRLLRLVASWRVPALLSPIALRMALKSGIVSNIEQITVQHWGKQR